MVEFLSDIEPADWLAIAVNALGIMAAILVAAWLAPRITSREEKRSSQERLLRMLLNTWLLPAHQDYQSAIVLIPMEFQGNNNVLGARKQYLDHVGARFPDDPKQLERHHDETAIRQTALIEAIATALSIDIKAADLMAGRYLAQSLDIPHWKVRVFVGRLIGCPSSDNLARLSAFQTGGFGSPLVDVNRALVGPSRSSWAMSAKCLNNLNQEVRSPGLPELTPEIDNFSVQ